MEQISYSKEQLKEVYKDFMLSACLSEEGKKKRIKQAVKDYEWLMGQGVEVGSMYDIGAAGGFFMEVFHRNGWMVEGCELSETQIGYAQKVFELRIEYGFIEDLPVYDIDLFVLWNTIEHLPDIPKAVEKMQGAKWVYINVPLNDAAYPHTYIFESIKEVDKLMKGFKRKANKDEGDYIIALYEA